MIPWFLPQMRKVKTLRASSWDREGYNMDFWRIEPGETRVLADIKGPGMITHIWMTQPKGYREVLLRIFWDEEEYPSVLTPLGDFFCLGNEIVNSFQSYLFSASTEHNNQFNRTCALNCYVPMPFRKRARIELVNEEKEPHVQYFYIDYETYAEDLPSDWGYFHAQFRRENPTPGWSPGIPWREELNVVNREKVAWENNYLILEAEGRGHYIGCNLSVANFTGGWWGEGDDMIWVDGYKWPPDLHRTGSEDYFNHAYGMQRNAFLRNGSSIHERDTGGYQTSYVLHLENPVYFQKSIRVTIEFGHANHMANDYSSVAYWYQEEPHRKFDILPVEKRKPVKRTRDGKWIKDPEKETPLRKLIWTQEMKETWERIKKCT